jgi:hypothetical protein
LVENKGGYNSVTPEIAIANVARLIAMETPALRADLYDAIECYAECDKAKAERVRASLRGDASGMLRLARLMAFHDALTEVPEFAQTWPA